MKRYDVMILEKLLDKYENSVLYTGKNQKEQNITFLIQKKTLPVYFDEASMQYSVVHEQLIDLEKKGFIRLIWKNKKEGHILDKCVLSLNAIDEIYAYLGRKSKRQKDQEILAVCEEYLGKQEYLDVFLKWVKQKIELNESIRKYVQIEHVDEFRRLCQMIYYVLTNTQECYLREFSVRCFCDSKIVERELGKALGIIKDFAPFHQYDELLPEEILEEYNIYKNPSWIMLKGNSSLQIQKDPNLKEEIYLGAFAGGIGLSNKDLENISFCPNQMIEEVVTIENQTTFHQWNVSGEKKQIILYLGGYHNCVKRAFLKKIFSAYPKAAFLHWGDIDCGGFRIWKDLCEKTQISFTPYYMGLETFEKYLEYGKTLTASDRARLSQMMKDPFFEGQKLLFQKMYDTGLKIEQEIVSM